MDKAISFDEQLLTFTFLNVSESMVDKQFKVRFRLSDEFGASNEFSLAFLFRSKQILDITNFNEGEG